jgi:hypothetical protein
MQNLSNRTNCQSPWSADVLRAISFNHLFLCFICFLLATPSSLNAQSVSFAEKTTLDIKNQMHGDEFTLIEVGDNSMPILISLSEQPITKGVVIIIGDADSPLGKKDSLSHIAKRLPELGWTTVVMPSLGLQSGPNIAFPIDSSDTAGASDMTDSAGASDMTDTAGASGGTDTADSADTENSNVEVEALDESRGEQQNQEETPAPIVETMNSRSVRPAITEAELIVYSQEVDAYLESVLQHMKLTMGHRIVVTQGITAATIAKLIVDNPTTSNIDALVINNPYWPIRKLNNKVPMVIAQTPIPVLDLTSYWDNNWSKQTAAKREIRARTELKEVYRQVEIVGQSFDQGQMEYITRQIKGWTTYLGW